MILRFLSWENWEMSVETDDVIDNDGQILSESERFWELLCISKKGVPD